MKGTKGLRLLSQKMRPVLLDEIQSHDFSHTASFVSNPSCDLEKGVK